MKSKMLIAALMSLVLCMTTAVPALAASPSKDGSLTSATIATQATGKTAKAGAWKINKKAGSYLAKHEKKVFKKAVKELDGVTYNPVFVMSSRVTAGVDYAFFCKATTATKKKKTSWKVVTVHEDPKGAATVSKIKNFNYKKIGTLENIPTPMRESLDADDLPKCITGAWQDNDRSYKSKGIPSSASKAFKSARAGYVGVDLTPIVLLASQKASGTNYRFLCQGSIPGTSGVYFYAVDVHKAAGGKSEITSCKPLKTAAYR